MNSDFVNKVEQGGANAVERYGIKQYTLCIESTIVIMIEPCTQNVKLLEPLHTVVAYPGVITIGWRP